MLPRRASGSWLVSARRSHLDLVADRVIGAELPSFQDVHARVSWRPGPRQHVSLVALTGRERIRPGEGDAVDAGYDTNTRNGLFALTFESSIGPRGSSRTIASFSHLHETLGAFEHSLDDNRGANTADSISTGGLLQFQLSRDIAVRDLAVRQEFVFKPSPRHWLDLGFETHKLDTRWAWRISGDRSLNQANESSIRLGSSLPDVFDSSRDSYRSGAWLQDRWQVSPRVALQPGLRVDRSSLTGETTLSPRLRGTLSFGHALRLDAALGVHTQSPGYEKVLHSDYFIDLTPLRARTLKAERSLHAVAGLQREFGGGLTARVDAYYKRFRDLIVGQLETDEQRLARLAGYDVPPALWTSIPTRAQITTSPLNAGRGLAYGVEVYVAYAGVDASAPLTGRVAYSVGRAHRTVYGVTHSFDYDRRHAVTTAANVRIGPRLDLAATGRWATGLPRTPVRGVRLALVPDADDADRDGNRDERVPLRDALGYPVFEPDLGDFANLNSARLPPFARLDARLAYRPTWSGERWAFYLDLINLLNAKNLVKIDSALVFDPMSDRPGIIERAEDRGMPFFPSFGIRFWF
jgi:outer membrane receptor for ferrienterochelin and colicin